MVKYSVEKWCKWTSMPRPCNKLDSRQREGKWWLLLPSIRMSHVLLYHFHLKLLTFSKVQSRMSSEYLRPKIGPSFLDVKVPIHLCRNTSFQFQHYYDLDTELTYSCFPGYKQTDGFAGAQCFFFNGTARWFGPGLLNNSIQLVCFYLTADKQSLRQLFLTVSWDLAANLSVSFDLTHHLKLWKQRMTRGWRPLKGVELKKTFKDPRPEKSWEEQKRTYPAQWGANWFCLDDLPSKQTNYNFSICQQK